MSPCATPSEGLPPASNLSRGSGSWREKRTPRSGTPPPPTTRFFRKPDVRLARDGREPGALNDLPGVDPETAGLVEDAAEAEALGADAAVDEGPVTAVGGPTNGAPGATTWPAVGTGFLGVVTGLLMNALPWSNFLAMTIYYPHRMILKSVSPTEDLKYTAFGPQPPTLES